MRAPAILSAMFDDTAGEVFGLELISETKPGNKFSVMIAWGKLLRIPTAEAFSSTDDEGSEKILAIICT